MCPALEVTPEAMRVFAEFGDAPLGIVAIVGSARQGKSTLGSLLGTGSTGAFEASDSTRSCTKGVFATVPIPVDVARDRMNALFGSDVLEGCAALRRMPENAVVTFLDTEGLSSSDRSRMFDKMLLSITTVLCSVIVFRSKGALSSTDFLDLSMAAGVASNVREAQLARAGERGAKGGGGGGGDFRPPALVCVVGDYSLEDMSQKQADSYLEEFLVGDSDERKHMRDMFPVRRCATMCTPTSDKEKLARLGQTDAIREVVTPEFMDDLGNVVRIVWSAIRPFCVGGEAIGCATFAEVASGFVQFMSEQALADETAVAGDALTARMLPSTTDMLEKVRVGRCGNRARACFAKIRAAAAQATRQAERAAKEAAEPGSGASSVFKTVPVDLIRSQLVARVAIAMDEFRGSVDGRGKYAGIDVLISRMEDKAAETMADAIAAVRKAARPSFEAAARAASEAPADEAEWAAAFDAICGAPAMLDVVLRPAPSRGGRGEGEGGSGSMSDWAWMRPHEADVRASVAAGIGRELIPMLVRRLRVAEEQGDRRATVVAEAREAEAAARERLEAAECRARLAEERAEDVERVLSDITGGRNGVVGGAEREEGGDASRRGGRGGGGREGEEGEEGEGEGSGGSAKRSKGGEEAEGETRGEQEREEARQALAEAVEAREEAEAEAKRAKRVEEQLSAALARAKKKISEASQRARSSEQEAEASAQATQRIQRELQRAERELERAKAQHESDLARMEREGQKARDAWAAAHAGLEKRMEEQAASIGETREKLGKEQAFSKAAKEEIERLRESRGNEMRLRVANARLESTVASLESALKKERRRAERAEQASERAGASLDKAVLKFSEKAEHFTQVLTDMQIKGIDDFAGRS